MFGLTLLLAFAPGRAVPIILGAIAIYNARVPAVCPVPSSGLVNLMKRKGKAR